MKNEDYDEDEENEDEEEKKDKNLEDKLRELKRDDSHVKPPNEETIRAETMSLLHGSKKVLRNFETHNIYKLAGSLAHYSYNLVQKDRLDPESDKFFEKVADKLCKAYKLKQGVDKAEFESGVKNIAQRIQDVLVCGRLYNLPAYLRRIDKNFEDDDAHLSLGIYYMEKNNPQEAKMHFKIAAELGNKRAEEELDKILDEKSKDDFERNFRENFERNLKEGFESTFSQKFKLAFEGHMNCVVGDYDQGIPKLERALEIDPEYQVAKRWLKKGKLKRLFSMAENATNEQKRDIYEEAKSVDPDHPRVRNNLGWAYFKLGLFEEAEKEFKAALKINAHYAEAEHNLGRLCHKNGDDINAAIWYINAIEDDTKTEKYQKKLLELLKESDVKLKLEVCDLASRMGDVDDLTPNKIVYNLIIQSDPENPLLYSELGMFYKDNHDKEQAITYFKKAVELDPNNETANEQLKRLTG